MCVTVITLNLSLCPLAWIFFFFLLNTLNFNVYNTTFCVYLYLSKVCFVLFLYLSMFLYLSKNR